MYMCVGQCAILWSTKNKNESDNKDNIFVIEKFTAGYICASFPVAVVVVVSVVVVVVGFVFGFRTATPKSMLAKKEKRKKRKTGKENQSPLLAA